MYVCAHRFCGLRIRTVRSREFVQTHNALASTVQLEVEERDHLEIYGCTQQVFDPTVC